MQRSGVLFNPVGDLSQKSVITCGLDDDVVSIAKIMLRENISGVVVTKDGAPMGMVTGHDFRDIIASGDPGMLKKTARDIMSFPLVTLPTTAMAFEAFYLLVKHRIHKLVLTDDDGKMSGIVTDTDLMRTTTSSPLYLHKEIDAASTIGDLKEVNTKTVAMAEFARGRGAKVRELVRLVSHFNDAVTMKTIWLMEQKEGVALPDNAAYMALGSEGRGEQTLRTDQDSAIVYADDASEADIKMAATFGERLVHNLVEIGVPPCPGNSMASNPKMRNSLSGWKHLLERWITEPSSENMVDFGIFMDHRTIYGNPEFQRELSETMVELARRNSLFFPYAARNILRFRNPLGWFNRFLVDKTGPDKGTLDIKKTGIFTVTEGVAILGLEAGITEGTTWDKMEGLRDEGIMNDEELDLLREAFTFLIGTRLWMQMRAIETGVKATTRVNPRHMPAHMTARLRQSVIEIEHFRKLLKDRYQVDFISR
ncbi:MAG: signal transduction protein [Deltaproteobacteria bacterium]|nr:MAG: signal transduction protein [Deltaproteobacteria bacterium]